MTPIMTSIVIALVVAVVVIVIAGTATGAPRRSLRQVLRDLRDGFRNPVRGESVGLIAGAHRELVTAAEAEGTVEDLFAIGETDAPAYVEPVELVGPLAAPLVGATRTLRRIAR
jgi:hypothetical protein